MTGALSGCGAGGSLSGSKEEGNTTVELEAPTDESASEYDSGEAAERGSYEEAEGEGGIARPGMEEESYAQSCYRTDVLIENTEEYSKWDEKGYSSVLNQPLSTFAADVDTASYSNLRRMITDGYLLDEIPEGAARVEEMINYFTYDYKEPKGSEPFGVTTVISQCPWNEEAQLLTIGLKTQEIDYGDAPAANLVFLLDVSGSMADSDKLPLLQEAFGLLAENLTDKDNGNYAYIDSFREAKKVLQTEMTATLLTICKDVKFQVEFNPAVVERYRLIGYENRALDRKDFNDDTKDAGEIGAGHNVTAMYELILKEPLGTMSENEIEDLKYSDKYKEELGTSGAGSKAMEEEWLTISIRYKKPAEDTSSLLQYPVDYDSYTYEPGEDFKFAAAVAEFGLLASHNEYLENASVEHVVSVLKGMNLEDEYKAEFEDLVKEVR
ncbi:hypothetical protein IMSAGC005_02087 [Lachnospiraceae bacterium]|nr:hypothetical protein IMSAGC005_02087 [Lachnospiraceae bacterium]